MQFTFRRNEEGQETIHVGTVLVAKCMPLCTRHDGDYLPVQDVPGVDDELIRDAIERADEVGFWERGKTYKRHQGTPPTKWMHDEVTVDVPVADNAVLSVTLNGDES